MKRLLALLALAWAIPACATIWYAGPGGGTRAQCTGSTDARITPVRA